MLERLTAFWSRLPAIIRGPIIGFVVFVIGSFLTVLPLLGNLQLYPDIPWAFPATLLLLWIYWLYFTGAGFPAATRRARENSGRKNRLSARAWRAALLTVIFVVVTMVAMRLIMPSVMHVAPSELGVDLSPYPFATVIGLLLSVAASAAVVEEVAFRGYMQKPLEDAYGVFPAVLIVGFLFWFAHQNHAELTYTHLPFHILASIFLGLIVYVTRSLGPAIAAHFLADIILQPIYVFKEPEHIYAMVSATPVWAAADAADVQSTWQKLDYVWGVLTSASPLQSSPEQSFVIAAYMFAAGFLASVISLFHLAALCRREISQ